MATTTQGNFITRNTTADLSAKQYYIVKLTNNAAVLATAGTDAIVGTLDEVPQGTTGSCSIAHVSGSGTGKVVASGAISVGDLLTATTGGKAIATTTANDFVFGRALQAATQDGDVIEYEKMYFKY